MTNLLKSKLETALNEYTDPYLGQNLLQAGVVKSLIVEPDKVMIEIVLGYPALGYQQEMTHVITQKVAAIVENRTIEIRIAFKIVAHTIQAGLQGIPQVKNIIAVASGKGGVGKSTVAVNLALALAAEGAKTGILDADIYGPSQPMMLGVTQPVEVEDKRLIPIVRHGIQSMSIGYLIDTDTPMVWRGPMVSGALQQLLNDTEWRDLDYLIVDLPPGTGDIQLTLAQKIPVSGAVIVTTPQDVALLDARKAIGMFQKVRVPVLGVVENMSAYVCHQCGHHEAVFGEGGGQSLAAQYELPLLGSLPLDSSIRQQTDSGTPTVAADPKSQLANRYREIARRLAAKLSLQTKNTALKFPRIVVENK